MFSYQKSSTVLTDAMFCRFSSQLQSFLFSEKEVKIANMAKKIRLYHTEVPEAPGVLQRMLHDGDGPRDSQRDVVLDGLEVPARQQLRPPAPLSLPSSGESSKLGLSLPRHVLVLLLGGVVVHR